MPEQQMLAMEMSEDQPECSGVPGERKPLTLHGRSCDLPPPFRGAFLDICARLDAMSLQLKLLEDLSAALRAQASDVPVLAFASDEETRGAECRRSSLEQQPWQSHASQASAPAGRLSESMGSSHNIADRVAQGSVAKRLHLLRAHRAGTQHNLRQVSYDSSRFNPGHLGRFRRAFQVLVRHTAFDVAVVLCILVNSAFIGLSAEFAATNPGHDHQIFDVIGNVFSFIFLFEFGMRLFAEGPWKLYCTIGCLWNWFDLVVVLEAMVDILFLLLGGDIDAGWSNLRALRFLKSIKLLRVLRVARIIQFTAAFRQFMHSTVVALKLLVWALLLLGLVVYMFAVFFTSAVDFQHPEWGAALRLYYGSVGDSAMTLCQAILGGLSWREAVLPLRHSDGLYEVVFMIYFCISYLTVLNVVTGVFTSVAIRTSEFDPDLLAISAQQEQRHRAKIAKRLFEFLDADDSGKVTLSELEATWSSGAMMGLLKSLGINTHDSWLLFNLLDCDGDGLIESEELCVGIQRLTGNAVQLELTRLYMGQKLIMNLIQNGQDSSSRGSAVDGSRSKPWHLSSVKAAASAAMAKSCESAPPL